MDVHKRHNFIVSVHTSAQWVKLALLAEPIFCNLDVTDGKPRGRRRLVLKYNLNQLNFSIDRNFFHRLKNE